MTFKLITMCNRSFLFNVLFCLACSIIYGQRTEFISDNGFSGTFDLVDNNLKEGSVIIEKLNTSIGEFSGAALKDFNIVFPVSCKDCSFTLKNSSEPYNVRNIEGIGFSQIIAAARAYSTQQIDAAIFQEAVIEIKKVRTLDAQHKLGYASYNQFTDKKNADKLLASIEAGEFLPNGALEQTKNNVPLTLQVATKEVAKTPPLSTESAEEMKEAEANKRSADRSSDEILVDIPYPITQVAEIFPGTEQEINSKDTEPTQAQQEPRNAYKNDACNKTITKLKTRLRLAEKKEDYLIINEVNHALKKHYRKCKK